MEEKKLKTLRILILISLSIYFSFFFAPYFYESLYEEDVLSLLFSSPLEPTLTLSSGFSWVILVVHLIAGFFLFFQVAGSKYLYLTIIIVDVIMGSLTGILAYTGLDRFLLSLLNISDGMIVYLLFISQWLQSSGQKSKKGGH